MVRNKSSTRSSAIATGIAAIIAAAPLLFNGKVFGAGGHVDGSREDTLNSAFVAFHTTEGLGKERFLAAIKKKPGHSPSEKGKFVWLLCTT